MCHVTEPFNTYLFVSDANAPIPLYNVEIPSNQQTTWWNVEDNAKKVANSLYLWHNSLLFRDIGKLKLPYDIGNAFYRCKNDNPNATIQPNDPDFPTYNDLMKSNFAYHRANNSEYPQDGNSHELQRIDGNKAAVIAAVFQGLTNPYTNTNMVLATRKNYSAFSASKWNTTHKNKTEKDDSGNYYFMLGLPPCHTGWRSGDKYTGWRKIYDSKTKAEFQYYLMNLVLENVFGITPPSSGMTSQPAGLEYQAISEIWNYAKNGTKGSSNHILNYKGVSSTDPAGGVVTIDGNAILPNEFDAVTFEGNKYKYNINGGWSSFGENDGEAIGYDWIDKHLCPWYLWTENERRLSGKFCSGNCTEQSMEHIAIILNDNE
jgi:hypothetical protein